MSNPISLAEAVAEIEQERTYLKEAPIFSREESDSIDNRVSAYDQALYILSRVTEVAELRAEVERLKALLTGLDQFGEISGRNEVGETKE